jgi:glycosyltransferase involved in cell wall biosynthesis
MAMQKSIVATPLSCDGIDLHHEQNVLYGRTTQELVHAVVKLIKDSNLRHKMAQANRELTESRFTWRRVVDRYEELYIQLIKARGLRV